MTPKSQTISNSYQAAQDRAAPLHFQALDRCLSLEPQLGFKLGLPTNATKNGSSRGHWPPTVLQLDMCVASIELCSKFLLISWARTQSLRRSLRSLTFSKVLLTTQQLQRTSLRISYGKFSRQTKEWSFSEKHVLGRCIFYLQRAGAADAADEADPIKKIKNTTVCQGSLKATFAYDSLTDCLRWAYGNFRSPIRILWILIWYSNNTVKKVAFALACFPYMQWHSGIINHRHSIACNSMHQMKHTTLFEPQLSWPDMDLRTAYGNMFVTNAYVKPFALLTKPKESLTTWWSLCKPNTKQVRRNLERCSISDGCGHVEPCNVWGVVGLVIQPRLFRASEAVWVMTSTSFCRQWFLLGSPTLISLSLSLSLLSLSLFLSLSLSTLYLSSPLLPIKPILLDFPARNEICNWVMM